MAAMRDTNRRRLMVDDVLDEIAHFAETNTPQRNVWTCGQCGSGDGVLAFYRRHQLEGRRIERSTRHRSVVDFTMTLICPRCSFKGEKSR